MITAAQMRAGRALLSIDQRRLAELSGGFAADNPADGGQRRHGAGRRRQLTKVVEAFDRAGIELIGDRAVSAGGGRGVRLKQSRALSGGSS